MTIDGYISTVHVSVSDEQQGFLSRLDRFQAPFLEEKLLKEGVFESSVSYGTAFNEFKRYVALFGLHHKDLAMTSHPVDQVWHQFILFTREYGDFCREHLGEFLHHRPNTSHTPLDPEGKSNLRSLYDSTYGTMPTLWDEHSENCSGVGSGTCNSCCCNAGG